MMQTVKNGFTLVELLVALLVMNLVMVGVAQTFSISNRTAIEQDLARAVEQNLRMAMGMVTDTIRNAGYGVPDTNLNLWITWVGGFTTAPVITDTSTVSVASCTAQPAARLAAATTVNTVALSVDTTALLDTGDLIWIGHSDHARIINVNTMTIDTNPTQSGNQGLTKAYPVDTPVCRVEVLTFSLATEGLLLDRHDGNAPELVAEGIMDLEVDDTDAPQYQITLTAEASEPGPITGTYLTRSLSSAIALKN